ncbi:hypothetical protein [Eubacterium limosum]|uniref:hypothetical protein n=1 Tax=Eubacterium limosum TaxID=1736 RepID=UPI00106250BE|nr:hypothetical protein [Eubacterium limosum]
MIIQKTINENNIQYYRKYITSKLNKHFSWGLFSLYLSQISSYKKHFSVSEKNIRLAASIERFVCDTDLLDDFMDKDNDEFNKLSDNKEFVLEFLRCDLMQIYDILNKDLDKKNHFTYNLRLALNAQIIDTINKLTQRSKPQDYFTKGVYRSVYLMNAIVHVSINKYPKNLFPFSFYYATASQIENDVLNLLNKKSSDLIKIKATLPILITYEIAKSKKSHYILHCFSELINEENFSVIPELKQYILENGIIEYCRWLALNCKHKAQNSLKQCFPLSNSIIDEWFQLY